jgi:glycosyltransferase involved in cell wall biosynthesis
MTNIFSKKEIDRDSKKYRIGCWFWELSKFPSEWMDALECIDELWAPTKFIQHTLSEVTKKPVMYMPVAVEFDEEANYQRKDYDLPDQKFLYLFSYDLHSFSSRKNPQAALNAFLEEFNASGENVGLVIKTIYGEQYPIEYQNLLKLAQNDNRIYVINKTLSRSQMYGLIKVCDCYISLHRAEGFGLGMAEAMHLGKPVIATAYSGNLDFMNKDNGCLVDYELIAVKDGEYPHASGQVWADPNIRTARSFMRRIFEDEKYRMQIAQAGQSTIIKYHSFERVGAMMVKRIQEIRSARGGGNVW